MNCGSNSVVECNLPKVDVASSSLVFRSIKKLHFTWGLFMDVKTVTRTRISSSADFGKSVANEAS